MLLCECIVFTCDYKFSLDCVFCNNEIVYFPIVGDVLLIRFDIKSI